MKQRSKWSTGLIILAIFLVSINLRPAVTSVGPILSTIRESLHVSSTQMSLLTSIPVFCMGLFAPLAVPIQKKYGYRLSITLLTALIGLATVTRIFFSSYSALIITSFLAGFAISIISPIINAYIKQRFPTRMEPVIGVYSFATGFGAAISAGFTGIFYKSFNGNWALSLGIWGLLAIVAMICWFGFVKDAPMRKSSTEQTDLARNPWKNKLAWTILIYFGLQTSLFFSLTTWLTSMALEQGMVLLTAGSVLTLMTVVQLVGNILIPSLINRYPDRIIWLHSLIVIGIIGSAIFFIDSVWAIWASAIILGFVLSGLFPIGLMLPLDEAKNNREANEWSSMVLSGGFMMSAFAPLIIGFVYDWTTSHYFTRWIIVILFILMSISVFIMQKQKNSV
ncbi:MFS transporter [Solibacillus sp. A46]|uniref:MFS transporter n=1 Tax=Solibacillus faecavium TaxID=2762221 RepID=A0ABR8XVP0_9BACL|nr:MFS transporter [Solibacillus faecavium]MBD8036012.1 MFS transporter [Solibacillus faecavium]